MKKLNQILQSNYFYILLIIISAFYIYLNYSKKSVLDINTKEFKGIIEYYKIDGDKLTLQVKGKERIIANYYIKSKKEKLTLNDKLSIGASIKLIGNFEYPSKNTIFNNFNYKKYLKSKKIYLIMNTNKLNFKKTNNIFYNLKNKLIKIITTKKNKEYFYTFILGNKDYLEKNVYDAFKVNNITHLFAISGMHISMLVLILKKMKFNNFFIIIFLYIYSFLVMFTPSVLRVTIFYTLKSIPIVKDISNNKLLLFTAFILIILNPFIIFDIGFQYSFIITYGLFLLKPQNMINISIYSFLLSLPISLLNNFEFNIFSILNNILIVPFVSIVLYPLLLLTFIMPFIEPILSVVIFILENFNLFLEKYALIITTGKLNILFVIIYYLIIWVYSKNKNKLFILTLIFIILINKFIFLLDSNSYVYYLDVSQGDSSIMITPYQKEIIMIDTGGTLNLKKEKWQRRNGNYRKITNIILFLKSKGITKINKLIITHGDYDHMGEAINLVNNFRVEKVIFNCGEFNDLEQDLIKVLDKKKIKYYSCIKKLNIDNNKLYFLNNKDYGNENDNSSVIYTELNNYKFLFMGDAGVEVEEDLIDKYNLKDIDVLKVGHHGSKTSSSKEFIDEINPKYSIISVGINNRYGHPNDNVLYNLENSIIYRTDQDGSIMFKINKEELKIETCTP